MTAATGSSQPDFRVIAPPGITNAQATAVAVGAVSQMDTVDEAFHSTGPAFWSYSFSKEDICRPVTAVHGENIIRSSGVTPGALSKYPASSSVLSQRCSSGGQMLSSFRDDTGQLVPSVDVYGAPDFNAMVAAAMYDSIKTNYDYILKTQYAVGTDNHGNAWTGMATRPVMKSQTSESSGREGQCDSSTTSTPTAGVSNSSNSLTEPSTPKRSVTFVDQVSSELSHKKLSTKNTKIERGVLDYVRSFFDGDITHPGPQNGKGRQRRAFRGLC